MSEERRLSVSYGGFACEIVGYDEPFTILNKIVALMTEAAPRIAAAGGGGEAWSTGVTEAVADDAASLGIEVVEEDGKIIISPAEEATDETAAGAEATTAQPVAADTAPQVDSGANAPADEEVESGETTEAEEAEPVLTTEPPKEPETIVMSEAADTDLADAGRIESVDAVADEAVAAAAGGDDVFDAGRAAEAENHDQNEETEDEDPLGLQAIFNELEAEEPVTALESPAIEISEFDSAGVKPDTARDTDIARSSEDGRSAVGDTAAYAITTPPDDFVEGVAMVTAASDAGSADEQPEDPFSEAPTGLGPDAEPAEEKRRPLIFDIVREEREENGDAGAEASATAAETEAEADVAVEPAARPGPRVVIDRARSKSHAQAKAEAVSQERKKETDALDNFLFAEDAAEPTLTLANPIDAAPEEDRLQDEPDVGIDEAPSETVAEEVATKRSPLGLGGLFRRRSSQEDADESTDAESGFQRLRETAAAALPDLGHSTSDVRAGEEPAEGKRSEPRLFAIDGGEPTDDDQSPGAFARRVGASSLQDLLEASAAYMAIVEGKAKFSRRDVMQALSEIGVESEYTKEARLKSFRRLLSSGALVRSEDGMFAISHATRFGYESRLRA